MRALNYEYLIRRVYHCGRYGVDGADADIYRGLGRVYGMYTASLNELENNLPRTWNQDINDLAFNYGVSAGEVAQYIKNSIRKVILTFGNDLTQAQIDEFNECISDLDVPKMDIINDVIDRAEQIMADLGIYPE